MAKFIAKNENADTIEVAFEQDGNTLNVVINGYSILGLVPNKGIVFYSGCDADEVGMPVDKYDNDTVSLITEDELENEDD